MTISLYDVKRLKRHLRMEWIQRVLPIKKQIDKHISTKKLAIAILCFLVFLLYLWPLFRTKHKFSLGFCTSLLQKHVLPLEDHINMNTITQHWPKYDDDKDYTPFIGNGYLGLYTSNNEKNLYIKLSKLISIPLQFKPISHISFEQHETQEAVITSYHEGLVHDLKCAKYNSDCVYIHQTYIMHRSIKSLFMQKIEINNPLDRVLELDFAKDKFDNIWKITQESSHETLTSFKDSAPDLSQMDVVRGTTHGTKVSASTHNVFPLFRFLHSQEPFLYAEFVIIRPKRIKIPPRSKFETFVYTIFHYSLPIKMPQPKENETIVKGLRDSINQDLGVILKDKSENLLTTHIKAWNEVWKTGFSISHSKSGTALNGDQINATFYTFLSHQPTYADPLLTSPDLLSPIPSFDIYPKDNCYNSHSTMLSSTLWSDFSSVDETLRIMYLWELTLDKNGCSKMIQSEGLAGTAEALAFSIGGLKLTSNHLEFFMDPKDLHRDMETRHVNYKNVTHISIRVMIGDDNRASLYVSIDGPSKTPIYACDAGCLDPLVALSETATQFPVKLTSPLTSLLYISDDKDHLDYLKHTIHVQEVVIAPAHEHHLIAIHKHGHNFGGLPTFFWVSIALLIVLFHLFLFKLIYSEYCGTGSDYYRDRYSV